MEQTIMQRKDILIGVGVIVVIALLVFAFGSKSSEAPEKVPPTEETGLTESEATTSLTWEDDSSNLDIGNISYTVEGETVDLVNGQSEVSANGKKFTLLEGPAFADLNGDNARDAVVLLREDTGGTGIFYHAAAVLSTSVKGGEATNSIFLGDRIRIKLISVANQMISISILEHAEGQPMAVEPTMGRILTLRVVDNELVEVK